MFSALRRCPASLSRVLSPTTFASTILRTSIHLSPTIGRQPVLHTPRIVAAFHQSAQWRQSAAAATTEVEPHSNDGPVTEFKQLVARGLAHPNLIDTITRQMKINIMTDVQSRTINEALNGVDVIAQAKTGTGKTLGFLVPVIQRIIENDPTLADRPRRLQRARADNIRAIVISPTRELAEQIAVEAKKITSATGVIVQCAVGGTQKQRMLSQTIREGCHLLIGTPGRLNDILSDPYSGVKAQHLNALVMDEADRLLDDGFSKEIDEIKKHLPDPEQVPRQTLMFSATIPRDVVNLVRATMRPGFHFAKCVDDDEEPTHHRIPQKFVHAAGFENLMPSVYEFILREQQAATSGEKRPFKAIVYFNSTAEVNLAASVFNKLAGGFKRDRPLHGFGAYEIHAKLSQGIRTRAADGFRRAVSGVLFSSDVTARGMDFPNVTHVIQIGLPKDRDTYIHRLGRTGRAGKEGEGWLFLTPMERHELRKRLGGLPLQEDTSLQTASVDLSQSSELPGNIANIIQQVVEVHKRVYPDQLDAAFRGLFGSYQWYGDKHGLLEAANRLAEFGWGMPEPPNPPVSLFSGGRRRTSGSSGGYGGHSGYGGDRRDGGRFGGRDGDRRSGGFNDRRTESFNDRRTESFNDRRAESFNDRRAGRFNDRSGRDFNSGRGGRGGRGGGFGERRRDGFAQGGFSNRESSRPQRSITDF